MVGLRFQGGSSVLLRAQVQSLGRAEPHPMEPTLNTYPREPLAFFLRNQEIGINNVQSPAYRYSQSPSKPFIAQLATTATSAKTKIAISSLSDRDVTNLV